MAGFFFILFAIFQGWLSNLHLWAETKKIARLVYMHIALKKWYLDTVLPVIFRREKKNEKIYTGDEIVEYD